MRRTVLTVAAIAAIADPAFAAGTLSVPIDTSQLVSLKGAAASVFVGNAAIADVSVVNRNTIVVTGKGYGLTNLMVLNTAGRTIMERQVQVGAGSEGRMTLYRGSAASNFSCAGSCERIAEPGAQGTPAAAAPANPVAAVAATVTP
jgi:Flp pilus assembly secretin CpaC